MIKMLRHSSGSDLLLHVIAPFILLLTGAACLSSCSPLTSSRDIQFVPALLPATCSSSKRVAILPFLNKTVDADIAREVRRGFYNHFSSRPYRDIELQDTDRRLLEIEKKHKTSWRNIAPVKLAAMLDTDYLIYGKVSEYKKLFLLVYAQTLISVDIRMVDGRTGAVAWHETAVERSRTGDLPLNPISLIITLARCGLHLQHEHTDTVVDTVCRKITQSIPDIIAAEGTTQLQLQLASFKSRSRAQAFTRWVEKKGFLPRVKKADLPSGVWYRVLLGPYTRTDAARVLACYKKNTGQNAVIVGN